MIFAGIALKLENIESQSMSIDAVGITTLMTGNSFNAQGSTLTLTRSPLESNISEWKVKKANEPKILARSGNYF